MISNTHCFISTNSKAKYIMFETHLFCRFVMPKFNDIRVSWWHLMIQEVTFVSLTYWNKSCNVSFSNMHVHISNTFFSYSLKVILFTSKPQLCLIKFVKCKILWKTCELTPTIYMQCLLAIVANILQAKWVCINILFLILYNCC